MINSCNKLIQNIHIFGTESVPLMKCDTENSIWGPKGYSSSIYLYEVALQEILIPGVLWGYLECMHFPEITNSRSS